MLRENTHHTTSMSSKVECKCGQSSARIRVENDPAGVYKHYVAESYFGNNISVDNENWLVAHINMASRESADFLIGHSVILVEGIRLQKTGPGLLSTQPIYFVSQYHFRQADISTEIGQYEKSKKLYRIGEKNLDHHHLHRFYSSYKLFPYCERQQVERMISDIRAESDAPFLYDIRGNKNLVVRYLEANAKEALLKFNISMVRGKPLAENMHPSNFYVHPYADDNIGFTFFYPGTNVIVSGLHRKACLSSLIESDVRNLRSALASFDGERLSPSNKSFLLTQSSHYVERHNCTSWALKHLKTAVGSDETNLLIDMFDLIGKTKPKVHAGCIMM